METKHYRLAICAATIAVVTGVTQASAQQRRQTVVNKPIFTKFDRHDDAIWWRTHDRASGKLTTDTGFHKENIHIENGQMTLHLSDIPYRGRGHTGASYKSRGLYHYGQYDVVMKAASGSGVISAFYTYTGPVYGRPHDEIDFEFLGRNTREAQLNFYVDGEPQLGVGVPLGFDAADDFHLYTIIWAQGRIVWKVDGEEVYRVERAVSTMPRHPGKIIADIWAAKGLDKWAGRINKRALPATAGVKCVSFRPAGIEGSTCANMWLAKSDGNPAP
ncbi:MAG: family 16 glycosylhydrolase [Pseudomonadota bacterium]